ncbi:MAG TPA: response regulator, partial [Anaerolineales bacterium]|nr:response regulator [Anaerolineales bacterium]
MPKTILIVDDEERIVSLLRTYLEQAGFRAIGARNGREALFAARHEKPDLIVLDLMMPEMDGYDFLRLHRKERETPIILLTARVEDEDKV